MVLVREAFAKINLYLEITGRRSDGFHSLRMLNQSVTLADKLTLAPGTGGLTLSCDAEQIPTDDSNLILKATRLFLKAAALSLPSGGLHFILEKKIPSQAGMGGGSTDGAAALLLLNDWFDHPLTRSDLFSLASELGADVPFSLLNGTAMVEGKGEQLYPLPLLTNGVFLIAKPETNVSTKAAFDAYDKAPIPLRGDFIPAKNALMSGDLQALGPLLFNHFEALSKDDLREKIKAAMLSAGALGCCLSGSGSAFFGLFADERTAKKAKILLSEDREIAGKLRFLGLARPCSGEQKKDL